jgi:TolB protein
MRHVGQFGTRRLARVRARCAVFSVGLVVVVGGAFPAPASAGTSGSASDTRIAWSRFVDLEFSAARIVIADAAGRGVRELTHAGSGIQDIDPAISPDGRWVAFERDFADGSAAVGLVRTNGRDEHIVALGCTEPCAVDLSPTWTPDGRHVVFTRVVGPFDGPNDSAASAVMYTADLDGRHVRRFSERGIDGVFEDYRATFAPSGYVVFVRLRNSDIHSAVFRMSPDATHVRRLTSWQLDADLPVISPASTGPSKDLVVFETYGQGPPDGVAQAIATVPANCSSDYDCARRVRLLTSPGSAPVDNFNPDWSPDGQGIAFVRFHGFPDRPPIGDIWTMRWDGSDKRQVSTSPLFEFRPNWGTAAGPYGS